MPFLQVICYLDDNLITRRSVKECTQNLEEDLHRLKEHGGKTSVCFSMNQCRAHISSESNEGKVQNYVGDQDLYVCWSGPSLLGRSCFSKIRLDWASIKAIHEGKSVLDKRVSKVPQAQCCPVEPWC